MSASGVRLRSRARAVRALAVALCASICGAAHADAIGRGDAAWQRRAEGEVDGVPRPDAVDASIASYGAALARDADDLEARWKLLRSLHFAGEFAARGEGERAAAFERAVAHARTGLERLAARVPDWPAEPSDLSSRSAEWLAARLTAANVEPRDAARLYFWSAIAWGAWSRDAGWLDAAREGVASRLHGYASVAAALEPRYEGGGALRLLATLHAQLPRIPLLTGWVDRGRTLPLLERAFGIAPEHPGNRLLLARALYDRAPERRDEARALYGEVVDAAPRGPMRVEDLAIRAAARESALDAGD